MPGPINLDTNNLEKINAEKHLRELAQKLTMISAELFKIFARENLSMADADKFVRLVLPQQYQEKVNAIVMNKMVNDVLKEIIGGQKQNG